MKRKTHSNFPVRNTKRYLTIPLPRLPGRFIRQTGWMLTLIAISNYFTHQWLAPKRNIAAPEPKEISASFTYAKAASAGSSLYLLDKAAQFIPDTNQFRSKVMHVSGQLGIAPEWLMAVMYQESKFDPKVLNYKGSGAVGLIQFMPNTAKDLNSSTWELMRMSPERQLDFVNEYLQRVKNKYGPYESLTDLYLGILYPRAMGQDYCYTLFAKPTKAYRRNSGLDENKDGRITVSDIDHRMRRMFPTAYSSKLG